MATASLVILAATLVLAISAAVIVARSSAARGRSGSSPRSARPSAPARRPAQRVPDRTGGGIHTMDVPARPIHRRAASIARGQHATRSLSREDRERYDEAWRATQGIFASDPRTGILDADRLAENVIRARGYRVPDHGHAADDAADTMPLVDRYRAAHLVAEQRLDPNVRTEDLWRAMAHYQAVLDALLDDADARTADATLSGAGPRSRLG